MNHKEATPQVMVARETRTTRTRPALCEALLTLLEERAFEQVTVRDLTERAGLGYATFFRHYPDKEALLNDLAARQINELLAMALPILYTIDSRASTQALCAYVWEHRKIWKVLLTGGAAAILKDEFIRQAQQAARNAPNGDRVPSDLRIIVPVAGTIEVLAWWLKQNDPPSVQRMAENLDKLVVAPIINAAKKETLNGISA